MFVCWLRPDLGIGLFAAHYPLDLISAQLLFQAIKTNHCDHVCLCELTTGSSQLRVVEFDLSVKFTGSHQLSQKICWWFSKWNITSTCGEKAQQLFKTTCPHSVHHVDIPHVWGVLRLYKSVGSCSSSSCKNLHFCYKAAEALKSHLNGETILGCCGCTRKFLLPGRLEFKH